MTRKLQPLPMMTAVLLLGALPGPATGARAEDPQPQPLTGDFYVGPSVEAQTDGATAAPKDHYFVTLTDAAAKAMYDALDAEEAQDECVGRIAKSANGLVCYGAKTSDGSVPDPLYECYFTINLKSQTLEPGQDC